MRRVLECSTKGDRRFSSLCAKIEVNGVFDFIEEHYQLSKRLMGNNGKLIVPKTKEEVKGKRKRKEPLVAFEVGGILIPVDYLSMYFKLLWYKYLKTNLSLEKVLELYDDYNDIYKSKTTFNCQADVIREYMQDNRGVKYPKEKRGDVIYGSCKPLIDILNGKNKVMIQKGDLMKSHTDIIGHQVNCQAVMGSGVAKLVKETYRKAYTEYLEFSKSKSKSILGSCQIVDCSTKIVVNLFCQFNYGRDNSVLYTDEDAIRKALTTLKDYAKSNNLSVALPYKIGCGYANGDWNRVYKIIKEIFNDYYVTLYKYEEI